MADVQRAVEEIRFVMQSEVWEMTDELRQAANVYDEACRDVNARLRRCDEFLKRGLRSEAIHLAEADSNLLETVALLDFAERRDWDEALGLYGIASPEPLRLDIAQELNEAYVIEQPLQKWLAKHRRLALARAPLTQRLVVMRKLASLDAESPFWEEDIHDFEKARLREIETEARAAAQALDVASLQALSKELTETAWRDGPPKALQSAVRHLTAQVDRRVADQEIAPLAEELETAFGALDLTAARALRDRWKSVSARAKIAANDPRVERIAPILGWVADEDDRAATEQGFQAAVAALDRALIDDVPLDELERAAHAAQKFERTLPESLVLRYRNRVAALELSDRRGRYLKIGAATAALVLVAALAGLVMQRQMAAKEADRVAGAVAQLVAAGEFAEARKLLDEHGDVSRWDRLLAVQKELAAAESAETNRAAEFLRSLGQARNAGDYDTAAREIEAAGKLARTGEEKLALSELQQSWEDRHRKELAAIEQQVTDGIATARDNLLEFERLAANEPDAATAAELHGGLTTQLTELQLAARKLRPEVRSQVEVLATRHGAAEQLRQRRLRELRAIAGVTSASFVNHAPEAAKPATDALVAALTEYANSLELPGAERIKQTLEEQPAWTSVLEWRHLTASWTELWPPTGDEQRARAAECDSFVKAHAHAPDLADARAYHAALAAILARDHGAGGESNRGQRARLEQYFTLPVIKTAWVMRTKAGQTYYLLDPKDFTGELPVKPMRIEFYVGYTRDDMRADSIKVQDFENKTSAVAPQSAIAAKVLERLRGVDLAGWDGYFLELAQEIRGSSDMDAFLKFDLLKRTLEAAAAGSYFLAEPLKPHLAALQTNRVDPAARWMDPDDKNAAEARDAAREIVDRLPDLASVWEQAASRQQALAERLREPVLMIGWLKRGDAGWECRTAWKPEGRYRLQVAYVESPGNACVWRHVGEASDAGVALRTGESAFLREGRPVFAVRVKEAGSTTASRP